MSDYNGIRDVIAGLEIFLAHGGVDCYAEHDEISSGQAYGVVLADEELRKLEVAGWFRSSDCEGEECEIDEDGEGDDDRHAASCNAWTIFV